MAAAFPAPGTQRGPCEGRCSHADCEVQRRLAATLCPRCGGPIGYGVRYYVDAGQFVHVDCQAATQAVESCPDCQGRGYEDHGPALVPWTLTPRAFAEALSSAYPPCRRCEGRGYLV